MEAQMLVRPHSQATTTPKVRADIQASDEPRNSQDKGQGRLQGDQEAH